LFVCLFVCWLVGWFSHTPCFCHGAFFITVILSSRRRDKLEEVAMHCQEEATMALSVHRHHGLKEMDLLVVPGGGHESTPSSIKVTILPYDAAAAADPTTTSESTVVEQALQSTRNDYIDVIFLNAGIFQSQPARFTSRDERERLWRVNFASPVDLTAELLKRRGTSHIVVTASVMAHGPHALSSTYAATKAALRNYFHTLALEEAAYYNLDSNNNRENSREKKKGAC
jgi:short-subunit dehydrogenase